MAIHTSSGGPAGGGAYAKYNAQPAAARQILGVDWSKVSAPRRPDGGVDWLRYDQMNAAATQQQVQQSAAAYAARNKPAAAVAAPAGPATAYSTQAQRDNTAATAWGQAPAGGSFGGSFGAALGDGGAAAKAPAFGAAAPPGNGNTTAGPSQDQKTSFAQSLGDGEDAAAPAAKKPLYDENQGAYQGY